MSMQVDVRGANRATINCVIVASAARFSERRGAATRMVGLWDECEWTAEEQVLSKRHLLPSRRVCKGH